MTTGRPRLESLPRGQRAIDEVRRILREHPSPSPDLVAYELRSRRVPRLSGDCDWTARAAKRVMDRAKEMSES